MALPDSFDINPREYGQLEAEVAHLQRTVNIMQEDIRVMRDLMEQSKGGWKMLLLLGGAGATLGSVMSWAVQHLNFR